MSARTDLSTLCTARKEGESSGVAVGYWGNGYHPYSVTVAHYNEVCVAPCETSLPAGGQQLAVAMPGSRPVDVEEPQSVLGGQKRRRLRNR